jgi:LPS sulfotransferase NodH
MTLPDFILFGAARSGSTALAEYLGQHPEVFVSEPKEPHFLAFEGERLDFRGPGDDIMMNRAAVTDLRSYERLFRGAGEARAIGDASISYLYYPKAIEGIRKHTPGARLLCILRNPADRAHSAFSFMRARMFEPCERFEDALADEDRRVAGNWHHIWHYRRMGYYHAQLKPWFEAFPREQIRICLFDDLKRDTAGVLRDCFEFIGVDPDFTPPDTPSTVLGGEPKNRVLHAALMSVWAKKEIIRPLLPAGLRRRVWRGLNRANLEKSRMAPETRQELLRGYREDILGLQDLTGLDLSRWLQEQPRAVRR